MLATAMLELLSAVIEGLPVGIYVVDADGKVVYWNAFAHKISGFSGQEVVGRPYRDSVVTHCDENGKAFSEVTYPLSRTLRDGEVRDARMYLLHKAGHRVRIHVKTSAIHDESGRIVAAVEVFDERTHNVRATAGSGGIAGHSSQPATIEGPGHEEAKALQEITRLLRGAIAFGVLLVQLRHLAELRAKHGEEATRSLMRIVKETIANTLRGTDVVVQRDHDFLLVLLRDCDEDGLDRTGKRVERLANTLGIEWWGDWISAGIAIGAASPQPGDTEQTLLSRAEAALTNNIAVSELTPQKQA